MLSDVVMKFESKTYYIDLGDLFVTGIVFSFS